jgi:hypothetical protein
VASDRKLIVAVIGDDSSFQKALARSTAAAKAFGSNVSRAMTPRGDLFKKYGMQGQVDDLRKLSDQVDKTNDSLERVANQGGQSLGAFAARAALVGVGVTTAYQASRRLSAALETTGAEAQTTTGRLKNMGAALLQGDLIGAAQAAGKTASSYAELGDSALETSRKLRDIDDAMGEGSLSASKLADALDESGVASGKLVREAAALGGALRAADNATNALADSTARLGSVFVTTTGQAVVFKGAVDDLSGLRGPGGVDAINDALAQARAGGGFRQAAQPGNRVNANKQALAQAAGDLDELLRLQKKERDRLREAVQSKIGNEEERKKLEDAYVAAQANVISTGKAIQANAEASAKAAVASAEADRRAAEAAAKSAEAARKAAAERRKALALALAEAKAAAEQARQFRALGLTSEGNRPTPTIGNLLKQVTQISGRADLTSNQRGVLARIRKVLVDPIHKASEETRAAAKGLIEGIRDTFDKELNRGGGPLTKTTSLRANKLIEGLGLGPDQIRELRARLSSFNSAGLANAGTTRPSGTFRGGPVTEVHTTVNLDGQVVGNSVTRSQQKDRKRNPVQKRGSRRGGV